jgi:glycosyltransferase involved in cell wall biosynthesis
MKILLIGEYSGLQTELKRGLCNLGHEVTLAAGSDFWKKIPADISLASSGNIVRYKVEQMLRPLIYMRRFTGFDVVHLVNYYTMPRISSFNRFFIEFLKRNNGVLTMAAAGDDPFYVAHSETALRYSPIPSHEKYDRGKRYYMRKPGHYRDLCSAMEHIDRVVPIMFEYYACYRAAGYSAKTSAPIPIPIDASATPFQPNEVRGPLVIFHGLNRPGFKGTHLIEEAFRRLGERYPRDISCVMAGRLPLAKYRELVAKTNIVVDQVYSYSLAMNALYSMAMGKVVLGGNEPESRALYGGESPPAVNIYPDIDDIELKLVYAASNRDHMAQLAEQSRDFVAKHHNGIYIAQRYCDLWSAL